MEVIRVEKRKYCIGKRLFEALKKTMVSQKTYPANYLRYDRADSAFNVMMMIGGEGPVVWEVFELRFCLGSHD